MEDCLWMGLRQGGTVGGLEMAYTYIVDLNVARNYCQISDFVCLVETGSW